MLKSIDNTETYIKLGGSVAYAVSIGAIESAAKALNVPYVPAIKIKQSHIDSHFRLVISWEEVLMLGQVHLTYKKY